MACVPHKLISDAATHSVHVPFTLTRRVFRTSACLMQPPTANMRRSHHSPVSDPSLIMPNSIALSRTLRRSSHAARLSDASRSSADG